MIPSNDIAKTLGALAHPSRVDIFKCLLAYHPLGLTAGNIGEQAGLPPSTLSHHLREMEKGGAIIRTQQGQRTMTTLNLANLILITETLMQLCCSVELGQDPNQEDMPS